MSLVGPGLPTWKRNKVDSYLGYTGRAANVIERAGAAIVRARRPAARHLSVLTFGLIKHNAAIRSTNDCLGANIVAAARPVLDDDLLAEGNGQRGGEGARDDIGTAPGGSRSASGWAGWASLRRAALRLCAPRRRGRGEPGTRSLPARPQKPRGVQRCFTYSPRPGRIVVPSRRTALSACGSKPSALRMVGAICMLLVAVFTTPRASRGLDTTRAVWVLSSSFAMVGVVPAKPPCSASFAELPL
jgi:hypothetical protein